MSREAKLFQMVNGDLKNERIQHVQVVFRIYNGRRAMKFLSVDTERFKEKVKEIAGWYCESLQLVQETKTTLIYTI